MPLLPSLHGTLLNVFVQPLVVEHASVVQMLPSSQFSGVVPGTQLPPAQRSFNVHALPSEQVRVLFVRVLRNAKKKRRKKTMMNKTNNTTQRLIAFITSQFEHCSCRSCKHCCHRSSTANCHQCKHHCCKYLTNLNCFIQQLFLRTPIRDRHTPTYHPTCKHRCQSMGLDYLCERNHLLASKSPSYRRCCHHS